MKKVKFMVVTTSRADYGILHPLLALLQKEESIELHLVATGTHLSSKHGMTVDQIIKDGLTIGSAIEMKMSGDSEHDVCCAIGAAIEAFSRVISEARPANLIVLGDRYELWPVCIAANIHKIPIVHIHGGETTFGALDENVRHSVTKMSAVHFPSIEAYGKRIIQMGEDPSRVFVVGALGIDCIKNTQVLNRNEFVNRLGIDSSREIALMTYHPVTLDGYNMAGEQMTEVLEAMLGTDLVTLVTAPNGDAGSNAVLKVIESYIEKYPARFVFIKNLGQKLYYSAMSHCRLMVGNSSSGIIESASFKLPVVNIGDRQAGRYRPLNVIDCSCDRSSILDAVKIALSKDFQSSLDNLENPYGDGNTAKRILNILKKIDFGNVSLIKKKFYDIS